MKEDKRRHERFAISQELELVDENNTTYSTHAVNISESGLRCTSDREIAPGARVSFTLSIPVHTSSMMITCEGTVLKCTDENGKFIVIIDLTDGLDEW